MTGCHIYVLWSGFIQNSGCRYRRCVCMCVDVVCGASLMRLAAHLCSPETVPVSVPIPAAPAPAGPPTPAAAAAVAHPVVLAPNAACVVATVLFLFLGGRLGPALHVETLRKTCVGSLADGERVDFVSSWRSTRVKRRHRSGFETPSSNVFLGRGPDDRREGYSSTQLSPIVDNPVYNGEFPGCVSGGRERSVTKGRVPTYHVSK